MPPPSPKNADLFIETEVYRSVKNAIDSGQSPILILGKSGSGKTTLLMALADYWRKSGRRSVFIFLRDIGREEDFLFSLRRELAEYSLASRRDEARLRGSSGRVALQATIEIIQSAPPDLLLLLDGLDEMPDPSSVLQLLHLMSGSAPAKVIVASRQDVTRSSGIFRSVFQMSRFTAADVAELIRRSSVSLVDRSVIDAVIKIADGLPLAVSLSLGLMRDHGVPLDVGALPSLEKLVSRLVESELESVDPEHRQEYLRALTSLAILNRPIHNSDYPAKALLELQSSSPLIVQTDAGLTFVHQIVTQALLSFAKLTSDSANLNISNLEFGAEEAERDTLLSTGFIMLPEFTEVLAGKKNIVVGDRGTGKSAMFAHLSMASISESVAKNAVIRPLTHPADMLRRLEANGSELSTADQFRAGWLTLVGYCLADQVKTFSSRDHARAAIYLREILGDDSDTGWVLLKFIKGIAGRILRSSVKIKVGPVMIEPAGKSGASGNRGSPIDLRAFIKDASQKLADSGKIALIPLDRVDEIHKYDRDLQQKAVQGLFLAEGELAQLAGIKLVIFLRSDLFKIYDIQEKNKLVSRSIAISWTKPQLLQFFVDRVMSNPCFHRLKELIVSIPDGAHDVALASLVPGEIEGVPAAEWLWEWLENGNGDVSPRQLILLLLLAAQSPDARQVKMDQLPIFPSAALQWGMDQLSELSFKELVDDFRVAPTFLANCRAGRLVSFDLAKVEPLFSKEEGAISVQVERLQRLGFLERLILQNSDGTKWSQGEVPKLFTRSWSVE